MPADYVLLQLIALLESRLGRSGTASLIDEAYTQLQHDPELRELLLRLYQLTR